MVVRRAEREAVALDCAADPTDPQALPYLKRRSSLLFVLARSKDHLADAAPMRAKPDTY